MSVETPTNVSGYMLLEAIYLAGTHKSLELWHLSPPLFSIVRYFGGKYFSTGVEGGLGLE